MQHESINHQYYQIVEQTLLSVAVELVVYPINLINIFGLTKFATLQD